MRALVKTAPGAGNVEIRDIEKPAHPGRREIMIRVKAVGICGTDLHVWQDKFMSWPPVVLGHEFSGEVVEAGADCSRIKAGDRVTVEPQRGACGECEFCRSGRMHMCQSKLTLGWRVDGAMTDYIVVPEMFAHKIPDTVSYELAAVTEPLAIAVYDIAEHGKINIGDFVVVTGCGPIGILAAYMARRLGAARVVVSGISSGEICRFAAARKLGADVIVNVERENLEERVAELTEGKMADVVIETSGAPSVIAQCAELLKRQGRIIGMGIPAGQMVEFPWRDAVLKSLEVYFSMSTSYTSWDKAISLLETDGELLKNIITWCGGIDEWESVFRALEAEKEIKAVFRF